jgi:diaminopimelate decarboxylase
MEIFFKRDMMNTYSIREKEIYIDELSVWLLAEQYGTPTYVYSEKRIRENFRRAYEAFTSYYSNFKFFYAVKACNNPAIVNILRQEGAGIDAASVNEILLANKVGLGGEDVMFSGNFLSDEDISQGLDSGVIFNLDDISILPRVLKQSVPEILSFRINPGYGRSNVGEYVTNAGPGAKFGLHPDMVTEAYRQAKNAGVKRFGVHMMPGSCITDPDYFSFVTNLLMEIVGKTARELKINFEFIDIGGGLGIPYRGDEKELDIEKTAKLVADTFKQAIKKYGLEFPRLMMEPARYFVGDAGVVIGKVHSIKESYSKIIGTDIGMNILARPAFYGSYHRILFNGREGDSTEKCGLCGQLCENTDFWIKERDFPETVQEGDIIVAADAGAYGFGMSYQYNGRLRPAEVLVNGNQSCVIRERETFEDMLNHTSTPKYLIK